VLAMLLLVAGAALGRMGRRHHIVIRVFALFWYTSVIIWVILYGVLYWSVRI
jgi:heme/copper-type cytochrome/quinol oxidase subunit 3